MMIVTGAMTNGYVQYDHKSTELQHKEMVGESKSYIKV